VDQLEAVETLLADYNNDKIGYFVIFALKGTKWKTKKRQ
jgi:hypothetical protein